MLTIFYLYTLEIYSFANSMIIYGNSRRYIIGLKKSKFYQHCVLLIILEDFMTNMTIMINMMTLHKEMKGTQPKSCALKLKCLFHHLKLCQHIAEVAVVSGVCFKCFSTRV